MCYSIFFFFSSRRRHTRCGRDWSSDVCSSDLAGAVLHEHEVGQINGYVFASKKISAVGSGENALFLAFLRPALRLAHVFKALDEGLDRFLLRRPLSKLERERMLHSEGNERCAKNRIRPRRKNSQRAFTADQGKIDLGADGFADPVTLHG